MEKLDKDKRMSQMICSLLLNASQDERAQMFMRCCGAQRWVQGMMNYQMSNDQALLDYADELWWTLNEKDFLEAFTHHPQIGASLASLRQKFQSTATWSTQEQSSVQQASEECLQALAQANQDYLQRHGFIFIICASGKSAQEMLDALLQRLANDSATEIKVAAAEQAKITRLRLEKLAL